MLFQDLCIEISVRKFTSQKFTFPIINGKQEELIGKITTRLENVYILVGHIFELLSFYI
jgi:hypothetical protein